MQPTTYLLARGVSKSIGAQAATSRCVIPCGAATPSTGCAWKLRPHRDHRRDDPSLPAMRSSPRTSLQVLVLEHYLDVLQRKPGAVRHARVVAQLGPVVTAYRDAFLTAHPEAYDEFVRALLLVRTHPWPLVLRAITSPAKHRVYTCAGVKLILTRAAMPPPSRPLCSPARA